MLTLILIGATVLVSWLAFNNAKLLERLILWPPAIARNNQFERLLTHGFIHADWQHLLFNMITLFFFGRFIEPFFAQYLGPVGFVFAQIPVGGSGRWFLHKSSVITSTPSTPFT